MQRSLKLPPTVLRAGLPLAVVPVCLLFTACSGTEPCVDGEPGIHFVIHLPIEAIEPAELGVSYNDDAVDRFDDAIPAAPWDDLLELRVAYGTNAVAGPATAVFSARPDPPRQALADFVADPDACTTVELTLALVQ